MKRQPEASVGDTRLSGSEYDLASAMETIRKCGYLGATDEEINLITEALDSEIITSKDLEREGRIPDAA